MVLDKNSSNKLMSNSSNMLYFVLLQLKISLSHKIQYKALPMDFSVGDTFSSYTQLEEKLKSYQSTNYVQMWKRDSRTIVTAQKRMPNRRFNPDIKYCELWYSCVHGGRKHISNSQAQRPHQSSFKADLPYQLKLRFSEDGQRLVITNYVSDHSHEVCKQQYNLLPVQRRLHQSDKDRAAEMF